MSSIKLETIGFDKDHLHMVISIPPKYSIAAVMSQLKGKSASRLHVQFLWLPKVYWNEKIVWPPGHFMSSVAVDDKTIQEYVERQGRDSSQLQLKL